MLSRHHKVSNATCVTPLGLIAAPSGQVLNLRQFALKRAGQVQPPLPTYAVVGTSMNAGKTETAAHIVRGLSLAGYKVGAAKLTGTGAGGDVWPLTDAGEHPAGAAAIRFLKQVGLSHVPTGELVCTVGTRLFSSNSIFENI